ncbi:hypothetical protein ACAW74_25025 [Fibrella sp. WM1]|uniref:hypothetical protein n=1 Tax=Fibrella musci TaxID=3242485 RepID=UPI00351FF2C1
MRKSVGLLAVCLSASFSACHRPVATFQRSPREVFYSPLKPATPEAAPVAESAPEAPTTPVDEPAAAPVAYADARPTRLPESASERIRTHQQRTQQLTNPARETPARPTSPARSAADAEQNVPEAVETGPGPKDKQRKTLREILGLPPRKQLNWWQKIPWQLKAAIVVILVAVAFALLKILALTLVFGIIGAFLLIRGLKKSFKVRRGIFNWRVKG